MASSVSLWRIDSGMPGSSTRRAAEDADKAGNGDGKISLTEISEYQAELKSIFVTKPTPREFLTDKTRRDAYQTYGHLDAVKRQVEHPRSEFVDHLRERFKPTTDSIDVMLRLVTGRFQ